MLFLRLIARVGGHLADLLPFGHILQFNIIRQQVIDRDGFLHGRDRLAPIIAMELNNRLLVEVEMFGHTFDLRWLIAGNHAQVVTSAIGQISRQRYLNVARLVLLFR